MMTTRQMNQCRQMKAMLMSDEFSVYLLVYLLNFIKKSIFLSQ